MPRTNTFACVRFQQEITHYWKDAPLHRCYLSSPHRHLLHVEVMVEVFHDDREIEYHDLLDICKANFLGGNVEGRSCEMLSNHLAEQLRYLFGSERSVIVSVFEDGECGCKLVYTP